MEVNKWLDEMLIGKPSSDIVYHDVIDEESGYDQLNSILAGSNETISKLNEYIVGNNERSEPYDNSLLHSEENFYINEGKAYYMNKDQWREVQAIINDCKNLKVLEKTLGKSPNISYKFTEIYKEVYENIKKMKSTVYSEIIKSFEESEVSMIIGKVLNNLLLEQFKQKEVSEYLFAYKKVCILIGIEMCNLYIMKNIAYEPETEGYEEDVTSKGKKIIRPKFREDEKTYELRIRKIINMIELKTISITDYMPYLHIDVKSDKEFEYMNAAILILHLTEKEEQESTLSVEDYNAKVLAQEVTANMAYHLGEIITNALIGPLFKLESDARKVPYLKLANEDLNIELTASAVFTKPMLMNEPVKTSSKHKVRENVTFNLKTKRSLVKTDANVKLYPKAKLEEILSHMTQYKIANTNYEEFLRYIEEILDIPFDKDNKSIQSFLWVYTLDFKEILENTKYPELVERLMKFGLKLDILFDKDLLKACKLSKSESCLRMYNVIISYKYYLKGLANDVAIYRRFNYFYLPRSITSTGRLFTIPYFLNLQNFKLTKAFVIMHKVSTINEMNYDRVKESIKTQIKTEELCKQVESINYEEYELKTRELARNYIVSFLDKKEEFSNYPLEKTYTEKIDWLSKHCRKGKEIFYAQLLYKSYYKEQNLSLIYELDATSSGLQLIGLIMKEEDICFLSNVIGNSYIDVYSIYIQDFLQEIRTIKDYLIEYYKGIGIRWDASSKESEVEVIDINNFRDDLLLFMNTPKEEILSSLSKLFTQIRMLSKEQLVYLNKEIPINICNWIIDDSKSKIKDKEYKQCLNYIAGISKRMRSKAKTQALENLIYIHAMTSYFIALNKNRWLEKRKSLKKRNLCKKCIMAMPYSMGSSGRLDALMEYLIDESNLNGFDISIESLTPITRVLDRYFSIFMTRHLRNASTFLMMIKAYIENHIPDNEKTSILIHENIKVETEYLTWVFMPYETLMKRLTLSKHQLAIYKHTGFMNKQLALTKFPAIYIHSADALTVNIYLEMTRNIENYLKSKKLMIKVGVFTNHDNFGISHEFSPFLKIILKETYNRFAESNYIENINVKTTHSQVERIKSKKTLHCTNDNFIKH